jgi:hypothetical protein
MYAWAQCLAEPKNVGYGSSSVGNKKIILPMNLPMEKACKKKLSASFRRYFSQ